MRCWPCAGSAENNAFPLRHCVWQLTSGTSPYFLLPCARRYLPPETQVVLVSATLPHDVLEMTSKFMTDPVRVLVKRDELTLEVRAQGFTADELADIE